jgi:hypothetical protein
MNKIYCKTFYVNQYRGEELKVPDNDRGFGCFGGGGIIWIIIIIIILIILFCGCI